jgi:hypothetical protein
MKTIIKYTFALALLTLTLSANALTPPPSVPELPEEAYINDIPFSTEAIFDSLCDASLTACFPLSEETYINDIPFNTEEMAATSLTFTLQDEEYIDDIPFDTNIMALH